MARFEDAIGPLLHHEGGFVDHPNDPGGATNYGVSLRYVAKEYGLKMDIDGDGDLDADDIRQMTVDQAKAIYRRDWWDRYGYGQIADQGVATRMFSFSVNMGATQAHLIAQRACRACGLPLVEDGIIGAKSRTTINAIPPAIYTAALRSEAAGYYRLIAALRPEFETFLTGWLNRAYA
jgi:lysozyme family protein